MASAPSRCIDIVLSKGKRLAASRCFICMQKLWRVHIKRDGGDDRVSVGFLWVFHGSSDFFFTMVRIATSMIQSQVDVYCFEGGFAFFFYQQHTNYIHAKSYRMIQLEIYMKNNNSIFPSLKIWTNQQRNIDNINITIHNKVFGANIVCALVAT